MNDIDLYFHSTSSYEELQEKRPDYTGARKAFLELAQTNLKDKTDLVMADFCCGTGNNTHLIADHFSVKKVTLIDINKEFIDIAKNSNIKSSEVTTIESDILKANLPPKNDLVISMFAYHHVTDDQKEKYLEIAKGALKIGGLLFLGEIYSPNKETTLKYYDHLFKSITKDTGGEERNPELFKFLSQTAHSDNFEFKVSREYAHNQLQKAGFVLHDEVKVWPLDNTFEKDVGTFVEVWRLEHLD